MSFISTCTLVKALLLAAVMTALVVQPVQVDATSGVGNAADALLWVSGPIGTIVSIVYWPLAVARLLMPASPPTANCSTPTLYSAQTLWNDCKILPDTRYNCFKLVQQGRLSQRTQLLTIGTAHGYDLFQITTQVGTYVFHRANTTGLGGVAVGLYWKPIFKQGSSINLILNHASSSSYSEFTGEFIMENRECNRAMHNKIGAMAFRSGEDSSVPLENQLNCPSMLDASSSVFCGVMSLIQQDLDTYNQFCTGFSVLLDEFTNLEQVAISWQMSDEFMDSNVRSAMGILYQFTVPSQYNHRQDFGDRVENVKCLAYPDYYNPKNVEQHAKFTAAATLYTQQYLYVDTPNSQRVPLANCLVSVPSMGLILPKSLLERGCPATLRDTMSISKWTSEDKLSSYQAFVNPSDAHGLISAMAHPWCMYDMTHDEE